MSEGRPAAPAPPVGDWQDDDDPEAALACYLASVDQAGPAWPRPAGESARDFFATRFRPAPARTALITGYCEPEYRGALRPDATHRHPLCAPPPGLAAGQRWHSRAEIRARGLHAGLELVWLASALDAFLAQVQGSVRVRLPDGGVLRLGFAARNGRPYRSIGAELIRRGAVPAPRMSLAAIRDWCAAHPHEVEALLDHNPSYVFFRRLDLPATAGPVGALGIPLTAGRSLAADPAHVPPGAPVWVRDADGRRRLMIAQDRGSAIRGPARIDIFCGSGPAAEARAGAMRHLAPVVPLLPLPGPAEAAR
ncbi:MltA domain-containing protein [Albidovulum sp.]